MASIKVKEQDRCFEVYGDKKRLDKELKLIGAKFSSVLSDGPGWTVPKTSSKLLFKLVKYINEDDEVKDDVKDEVKDEVKDDEVKDEVKEEVVRIVNKQRIRSKDRRLNITRERERERQREIDILKEKGKKGRKVSSSSSDEESTSDGSSSSDSYPSPSTPKRKIDAKDYKKLYNQVQSLQRKFERLR